MPNNKKCPNCGSPQEYPTKVVDDRGMRREYPTTYTCGTVTSPNWDCPLIYCKPLARLVSAPHG